MPSNPAGWACDGCGAVYTPHSLKVLGGTCSVCKRSIPKSL